MSDTFLTCTNQILVIMIYLHFLEIGDFLKVAFYDNLVEV